MTIRKLILRIASLTRSAISRIIAAHRRRRAEMTLKDLSPHILNDIGQEGYRERSRFDRDQVNRASPHFRW